MGSNTSKNDRPPVKRDMWTSGKFTPVVPSAENSSLYYLNKMYTDALYDIHEYEFILRNRPETATTQDVDKMINGIDEADKRSREIYKIIQSHIIKDFIRNGIYLPKPTQSYNNSGNRKMSPTRIDKVASYINGMIQHNNLHDDIIIWLNSIQASLVPGLPDILE